MTDQDIIDKVTRFNTTQQALRLADNAMNTQMFKGKPFLKNGGLSSKMNDIMIKVREIVMDEYPNLNFLIAKKSAFNSEEFNLELSLFFNSTTGRGFYEKAYSNYFKRLDGGIFLCLQEFPQLDSKEVISNYRKREALEEEMNAINIPFFLRS